MDFINVTSSVIQELRAAKVRLAAIGGFALGFWGVSRTTTDVDFLLHRDDLSNTKMVLERANYQLFHETKELAQFQSQDRNLGNIDFVLAHRSISLEMLRRSVEFDVGPDAAISVLQPEDIIGLKIQALHNDPKRTYQDVSDIEALLRERKGKLDLELIASYFELFDKLELFEELKRNVDAP